MASLDSFAHSRNTLALVILSGSIALFSAGCKPPDLQKLFGVPVVAFDKGTDPQILATVQNPCELDLDFGNVPIGETETATIQIQNKGSGTLDLLPLNPNLDPEFGLNDSLQSAIAVGSSGTLTLTFQPYKTGPVTSTLSIDSDGTNASCSDPSQVKVVLSATGIQLSLSVQPNVLDFGNTLLNTTSQKSVLLINKSNAPVNNIVATVSGGDASLFKVLDAPTSLAANAQVTVDLSYSPLALETRSVANVIFTGGEQKQEQAKLALFGEPVNVALTFAPNPCNFGYVPPLTTAVCCTEVTNQANLSVTIKSVTNFDTAGNAFALATTDDATPPKPFSLPITIQGGAESKVCFSLTPPIIQQYQGQATLSTDELGGTNPIVQLTGWGGGPQLTCAPLAIDFGETIDHSISTVPVICTNTGTAIPGVNLLIDPPTASPSVFTAEFDQSKNVYPLGGLAPGQSAQIDVNYAPTTASNDKGTLFIKSNGGQGKTLEIPLSGTGLDVPPCQFVVAPSALDFANVQVGDTSSILSFDVQNVGANICLVQGLKIKNDPTTSFRLLTTSIAADPDTGKITIPAPGSGAASNLRVSLEFAPTVQSQAFSAEVAFSISDPSAPNQVVQLTGTSETTCLVVAPSNINFGDVGENDAGVLCTSTSRTFSLFNECQTSATVKSMAVQSGPGDILPQFSTPVGPTLPNIIPAGAPAQVYEMYFQPLTLGQHTGQILISDGTVETLLPVQGWAVATGTETDTFVVGPPKADVLWIMDVDDDGDEQKTITNELPVFFSAAADIDYRMAITTDNDGPTSAFAEFGRLVPCPNCSLPGPAPMIISPSTVPLGGTGADPLTAFSNLWASLNAANPYGPDEHFFLSLYNALQHGPQPGVDFFRPGVFFAAITDNHDDEPDHSEGGPGAHNPTWYANFFETYFQNPFLFTWNYINPSETITGTGFSNYLQLPPSIQQMISATNGFALNTTDKNWASALTSVWTSAITAHTYYPLIGSPSEGQTGITVTIDGVEVNEFAGPNNPNWTYQATLNAIVFNPNTDPPKMGATISVTYPIGCK